MSTSRTARAVAVAVGAWAGALALNRRLVRVRGVSMAPTLAAGDVVLTLPVRRPRRGEVVVLRDPRDRQHVQVKRVVGLPGESVRATGGRLLVDGRGLLEHYTAGGGPDGRLDVPADHVAVLGDARTRSTDSRAYGAVPLDLVAARVVARVRPGPRLLHGRPVLVGLAAPSTHTDEGGAA